ncbi:MAG: hypothetical protein ACOWWR_14640 [Eubacteriales bacterium]
MLVRYDQNFRRAWMFPRNIRKIHPWKLVKILTILDHLTDTKTWKGNQTLQNSFINYLSDEQLKTDQNIRDPHSGGGRTYLAQLKSLGLVFEKDNMLFNTLAGEALISGDNPLTIIQKQLLKHQYPSSYSFGQNVKIHPAIKVKPFLFIIDLLDDPEIKILNCQELIFPIIYGHNDSCLKLCKDKILEYRFSGNLYDVIDNPERDLYTPRIKNRSIQDRINTFIDIANTLKNYLESSFLVKTLFINGVQNICINEDFRTLIEDARHNQKYFIPHPENEESFLRNYGLWNRSKDTRNLKKDPPNLINNSKFIRQNFFLYCGENLVIDDPNEFAGEMEISYGFTKNQIIDAISDYLPKSQSLFEYEYLMLATGGQRTARKFEFATGKIFKDMLRFEVELTGQRHRKGRGGYSDIFLIALNRKDCAIVDTKATSQYTLSHEDILKMSHTYIANYKELCDGRNLELKFCSYVAGGFRENIETGLRDIHLLTKVPASAITAKNLLDLSLELQTHNYNQDIVIDQFSQNKYLN